MMNRHGYKNVLGIDSDPEKIKHGVKRGLNLKAERAFEFLQKNKSTQHKFDLILAEQEINHLTKQELLEFYEICKENLKSGGSLIVHVINGANPIVGSEALSQNFDHYFTFHRIQFKTIVRTLRIKGNKSFSAESICFLC